MAEDSTVSDADLLRRIRDGDLDAMGVLYQRHKEAALRVARATSGDPHLAQDLVNTAFERIHAALMRGRGPGESFRAYLYTVIRRLAAESGQARAREEDVADWEPYSAATTLVEGTDGSVESRIVAAAFSALPERHQAVLWYLDVEGMTPAQAAPFFDLSPNAVSALAVRARDGLRDAYVQAHVADAPAYAECAPTRRLLGAYRRGSLSARDTAKVEAHLAECDECSAVLAELRDVTGGLRSAFGPIFIGSAAAGGIAAAGALGGGTTAAHAAGPGSSGSSVGTGLVSGIVEKVVIGAVAALAVTAVGSAIVNVSTLPATDLDAIRAMVASRETVPPPVPPVPATPSETPTATPTPTPTPPPVPQPPAPPAVPPAGPAPVTPEPVPPDATLFLDVVDEGDAGLGDGTRLSRVIVEVTNTHASDIDATVKLRLPGGMTIDSGQPIAGDPVWACPDLAARPVECTATGIVPDDAARIEIPVLIPAADVGSRPVANLRITNS